MSDTFIHNIKISYDESSQLVRDFSKYLKSERMKEAMKGYYKEARSNIDNKIYISDEKGNEFIMVCKLDHICSINLRGM